MLVTACPTRGAGCARRAILDRANLFDYLICSGGDGTISEVVDALLQIPPKARPALGFIPSGTINDFAASLDIPRGIISATAAIIRAEITPIDIGKFGNKHFSYVAAFGMFTDVSYATPQNSKNLLGRFAYFLEGIKRLGGIESYQCELDMDEGEISGDFILAIIANSHSVAGISLPEYLDIRMDDGVFEILLVRRPKTIKDHQEIISSLLAMEPKSPLISIHKSRQISIRALSPIPWTIDGDFGGTQTNIQIENLHHAIRVIVPKKTKQ